MNIIVSHVVQVKDVLVHDCMCAMEFCLDSDKEYHKALYQIARTLAAQGKPDEAKGRLEQLFSRPRHKFNFFMEFIQENHQVTITQTDQCAPW